jgi:ribosomal protein S18 acetylase RimI-like enzyme
MNGTGCSVERVPWLSRIRGILEIHDATWGRSMGIVDLLSRSTACFMSVDAGGRVCGYCFVEEDVRRGFFELQDIAVSPDRRNRGVGRTLMGAVMSACPRIKLMTRAGKPSASFFQKLGFVQEQVVENYYDVGEDALRMSWNAGDR